MTYLRRLTVLPLLVMLLPLDVVVALTVLLFAAVFRYWPKRSPKAPPESPRHLTVTVQILNWNGRALLEECLPSVVDAVARAGPSHELVVVDNGSSDGSVKFLQDRFPTVRVLALDRNYRFSEGNNIGARQCANDIIVFLNNDMIVDRDFLAPLVAGFHRDPQRFAVTSQVFLADPARPREETGRTRGRFSNGFVELWHEHVPDGTMGEFAVLWAGGGSSAVDRRKFLELGGFDRLYEPFYVEDADLSYAAWQRGWSSVMASSSKVIHKHRATSRPHFGDRFVDNTIRRNLYLLVWKNFTSLRLLFTHFLYLPRTHARSASQNGAWFEIQAFLGAVRRLPAVCARRWSRRGIRVMDDADILGVGNTP